MNKETYKKLDLTLNALDATIDKGIAELDVLEEIPEFDFTKAVRATEVPVLNRLREAREKQANAINKLKEEGIIKDTE